MLMSALRIIVNKLYKKIFDTLSKKKKKSFDTILIRNIKNYQQH